PVKLHSEVTAQINLVVEAEQEVVAPAEESAAPAEEPAEEPAPEVEQEEEAKE
ncbi:MAG: 50S ribosomal protein L9, partial [Nitrospina sp.]|nr:50S ribosomal protein L9 [Nitrospina sp.]MBT4619959.1 50S ribosomal protein L9 [Nitrospina sp.]